MAVGARCLVAPLSPPRTDRPGAVEVTPWPRGSTRGSLRGCAHANERRTKKSRSFSAVTSWPTLLGVTTTVRKKKAPSHWKNRIVGQGEEPPDNLLANPLNWRVHPAFQQEAMIQALSQIGWVQRVIVNQTTGHVLDGHLRVAVAITKGEPAVPVSYVALSPDEERLVLATLDPLANLAVADQDLLKELLGQVSPFVTDDTLTKLLADLGNGQVLPVGATPDLDDLLKEETAPEPPLSPGGGIKLDEVGREIEDQEPDQLLELAKRWGTAPGQTWLIASGVTPGREHVLKIGSCTDRLTVDPLKPYLPKGAVIVTSPPYGMGQAYEAGYEGSHHGPITKRSAKDHRGPDQTGGRPTEAGIADWLQLMEAFCDVWAPRVHAAAINLADHTVAPTPGYGRHTYGDLVSIAELTGWKYVATRMWVKPPMLGNNPYWLNSYKCIPEFEYVGFFSTPGEFPFRPVSERVPASEDWRFRARWEFGTVGSQQMAKGFHPAAFPVELPRRCTLLFTDPGGTVVDPFLGSGTTMVAAESLGRLCVGVESDPVFAAMALERLTRLGLSPRCTQKGDG